MSATASRVWVALGLALLLVHPLLYAGVYAGDAIIHLVYAEHAARGALYVFNPGEPTPGVTSSGYMLLLAGLFRALPAASVPAVAKAIGIVAWWGSIGLLYGLARTLLRSRTWAFAVALIGGSLPGSVHNASVGMETPLFVALVTGWLWLAARSRWLDGARVSPGCDVVLGGLLGAGFWLRPEAAAMAVLAFGFRGIAVLRSDGAGGALASLLRAGASAALPAAAMLAFHHAHTGAWLPTSGMARIFIASLGSISFGPLLFDPAFALRLAAYAPLSLPFLLGSVLLWRRGDVLGLAATGRYASALFGLAFLLYSFVTGAHHLSRYTSFVMPGFVLVAVAAVRWAYGFRPAAGTGWQAALADRRGWLLGALCGAGFAVLAGEAAVRLYGFGFVHNERLGTRSGVRDASRAPAARRATSDALLARLGSPAERPVVVALQEVQLRYELDDRFVVRSLDGRVDPLLLEYASRDHVDHVGYLRARGVHYLLEAPHYVRDPHQWSIASLRGLQPGQSAVRERLRFTRLEDDAGWRLDEEPEPTRQRHRRGRRPRRSAAGRAATP